VIAGRYSLDSVVGRGGMGVVWRGEDRVLGRDVAVKRVGMEPGGDGAANLRRAEREARLAASLDHSHVVTIFDLVDENDEQWLVMEYVDGATLTQLVNERGRLTPDEAACLLSQAADALAAAHRGGIVHRDVKPSNLLVAPYGQVKITDFGIARGSADATLTQTGLMSGSPAYLAPEVAIGRTATPASDVWSLGATLFHAVTGAPPYDATGNVLATLYRIVNEDPPRPRDPGWLAPVFEATMTKDPADRWTMEQVRDFLATRRLPLGTHTGATPPTTTGQPTEVLAAPAVPVPREPQGEPQGRRRVGWPWAALAAVLVAATVAFLAVTRSPVPASSRTSTDRTTTTRTAATRTTPTRTAPTASDVRAFVDDYLATVTRSPAVAWRRLTPGYRAASGGFDAYRGFWSTIASARPHGITAAGGGHGVSYAVDYVRKNGTTAYDRVTLRLVGGRDDLRIAGEG
jgi:eukaryotic-like serine/threonine-protein kinase